MSSLAPTPTFPTPTQTPTGGSSLPTIQFSALYDFYSSLNVFVGTSMDSSWKWGGTENCADCTTCQRINQWNFRSPTARSFDVCSGQWCGLTCDGNTPPNVQTLVLTGMNLQGPLPNTLADLSALETLRLNKNLIVGTIPNSLHALSQLKALDLSDNQLSGTLPPQLGSLLKLRVMKIVNTGVKGQIPTSYCNLVTGGGSLQELFLTGNGGLICFPGCLQDAANPNVLVVDPSLHQCGQGTGAGNTLTISQASDDQRTITIAAGIAGGLVGLLCILGLVCLLVRTRRARESEAESSKESKGGRGKSTVQQAQQAAPPRREVQAPGPAGRDVEGDPGTEVDNPLQQQQQQQHRGSVYPHPPPGPPQRPSLKPLPLSSKAGPGGPRGAGGEQQQGGEGGGPMGRDGPPRGPPPPPSSAEKPRFQFGGPKPTPGIEEGQGSESEGSEGSDGDDGGGSVGGRSMQSMQSMQSHARGRGDGRDRPWAEGLTPELTGRPPGGYNPNSNPPRGPPPDRRQTMGPAGRGGGGGAGGGGGGGDPRGGDPRGGDPRGPPTPDRRGSAVVNSTIRPEMQEAAMAGNAKKFSFMMARGPPPPPPGIRGPPPGAPTR